PTFITGGVTPERMEEAYSMGNCLTAAGFDLILKGEDPATLTPERVAERLRFFLDTAKAARERVAPLWGEIFDKCDEDFVKSLPHFFSLA
ncbi:MAG: hypothetical protein IKC69_05640, partial [Clostridia bacterium]|nr:hypothetical protein [Clostridia bacterium]